MLYICKVFLIAGLLAVKRTHVSSCIATDGTGRSAVLGPAMKKTLSILCSLRPTHIVRSTENGNYMI